MNTGEPYLIQDIVLDLAAAGQQVTQLGAAEASSGNISVFVSRLEESSHPILMQAPETVDLPVEAASLAGGWLFVTGTGRRLRDIAQAPFANLCLLHILAGGRQAHLHAGQGVRPTGELNSHLSIHASQARERSLDYHAILHAQPFCTTFLSHIPRYADLAGFNRCLLRWQPETIMVFPSGIGVVPFHVPGSQELMEHTVAALREHQAVVWSRHGVAVRSDFSAVKCADLIEYLERAAQYECFNLQCGEPASGLSDEELRQIAARFHLRQPFF